MISLEHLDTIIERITHIHKPIFIYINPPWMLKIPLLHPKLSQSSDIAPRCVENGYVVFIMFANEDMVTKHRYPVRVNNGSFRSTVSKVTQARLPISTEHVDAARRCHVQIARRVKRQVEWFAKTFTGLLAAASPNKGQVCVKYLYPVVVAVTDVQLPAKQRDAIGS